MEIVFDDESIKKMTFIGLLYRYSWYIGKEQDDLTGMYYYGARYYDPRISVWHGVDPLADHPNQVDKSPYSAFWNNPVKYNDPDGRCPICPFIILGFLMLESHPASTPGSHKDHVTIKQAQDDYNKSQLLSFIPGGKETKVSQVVAGRVINEVKNEIKD